MKLLKVFIILAACQLIVGRKRPMDYGKFTKVSCNSTSRCPNVRCHMHNITRSSSYIDAVGDLPLPVAHLYVNLSVSFKTFGVSGNYRQVVKLDKLDICELNKNLPKNDFLKPAMNWFNNSFNGLVHECPYPHLNVINGTLDYAGVREAGKAWQVWPSGMYKLTCITFDELGEISAIVALFEVHFHFHTDNF